jgi:hypothetical protein
VASTLGSVCLEALRAPAGCSLPIAPASLDTIRARAPKQLTSGETLDFRTLVPQPGGLFDYKVFGPGTVIDAPAPDLDAPAHPPRTQFGRLVLAQPMPHPLALAHAAARIAELAGWTAAEVDRCKTDSDPASRASLADALDQSPEGRALVLRELPVLPPDLRPLVRLSDDRWQTSPINELYRHALRRTDRLLHLFENEDQPEPLRDRQGEVLTSLRGLAGGTGAWFASLAERAAGVPQTGRHYRAEAVLFALGFELAVR